MDGISRLLQIGLGLLLITASALKMHWHTHSPPQLHAGWLDNLPVVFVASVGELCLGSLLLAGLWSQGIRLVSISIFILFLGVALGETIRGFKNCGCFGGGVHVPSWAMVICDSLAVILLLRCKASGYDDRNVFSLKRIRMTFAMAIIAAGVATAAVWAARRPPMVVAQSSLIPADADPFGSPASLVLLDPEKLAGKPLLLASHIDIGSQLSNGRWIVLLVHNDCDVCAGAVPKYQAASSTTDAPKLAIIEMPPYGSSGEPAPWPTSTGLFGKLDTTRDWFATTPVAILLKDGVVQAATDGEHAAIPNSVWFRKQ